VRIGFIAAVLFIVAGVSGARLARGQEPFRIRVDDVQVRFPSLMNFQFEVESVVADISEVRLVWQAGPEDAFDATRMAVWPSRTVTIQYPLDVRFLRLPPFAQVTYRWEVRDTAGNLLTTENRTVDYADSRHDWRTLENERIRMLWYGHGTERAEELFALADEAYVRLAMDFGVELTRRPSVIIYADQQAFADVQGMLSNVEFVIGRYFPGHNITVNLVTPEMPQSLYADTLAHEISHLYSDNFYVGFSRLPLWLEEGLATYNENVDLSAELHVVQMSAARDALVPFIGLGEAIRDRDIAISNLAYAEGATIFGYIQAHWGQARLVEFLGEFRNTTSVDEVMQRVFDQTMPEFEVGWRAWLGYPVEQVPQLLPTATLRPMVFPTPTYRAPGS
jgi:hypothetical protein